MYEYRLIVALHGIGLMAHKVPSKALGTEYKMANTDIDFAYA